MENVMTNDFCELNENEMMETDGGLILETLVIGGIVLVGTHVVVNAALGIQNIYLDGKDKAFTKHCNDVLNQNIMLTK